MENKTIDFYQTVQHSEKMHAPFAVQGILKLPRNIAQKSQGFKELV
jgi:hypothetical protein